MPEDVAFKLLKQMKILREHAMNARLHPAGPTMAHRVQLRGLIEAHASALASMASNLARGDPVSAQQAGQEAEGELAPIEDDPDGEAAYATGESRPASPRASATVPAGSGGDAAPPGAVSDATVASFTEPESSMSALEEGASSGAFVHVEEIKLEGAGEDDVDFS